MAPISERPASNISASASLAGCSSTSITPACVQALYGVPTTKATQSSNVLGVSGFIDQFANQADLKVNSETVAQYLMFTTCTTQTFLTKLRPDIPSSTTFTLQTLDGGSNDQSSSDAGVEAVSDASECNRTPDLITYIEPGHSIHRWCSHGGTSYFHFCRR